MPLVRARDILHDARQRQYGIPCLLAGDLSMIVGEIRAAEALDAPLILAFNQQVTPAIPPEVGIPAAVQAAGEADVPVAVILDHGASLEQVVTALRYGISSVMFDGSHLPYKENVRQTAEVVRLAHAVGVDVEAELGGIPGSSVELGAAGPAAGAMTDPEQAVDFVQRTGADVLAISFGNAHGVYPGAPQLDLARVKAIYERIDIPLAMHGGSGLSFEVYPRIVQSGISKINYYSAMAHDASLAILQRMREADSDTLIYHQIISQSINFFAQATQDLLKVLGSASKARAWKQNQPSSIISKKEVNNGAL
jgi:fructose-bisphosphate aldolase class II